MAFGPGIAKRVDAGFLAVCIALAASAAYELVERGVALALGQAADEFLRTQGDCGIRSPTLFAALIGAIKASRSCPICRIVRYVC